MSDTPKEIVKAFLQDKFPGEKFPKNVDGLKDFCFAKLKGLTGRNIEVPAVLTVTIPGSPMRSMFCYGAVKGIFSRN